MSPVCVKGQTRGSFCFGCARERRPAGEPEDVAAVLASLLFFLRCVSTVLNASRRRCVLIKSRLIYFPHMYHMVVLCCFFFNPPNVAMMTFPIRLRVKIIAFLLISVMDRPRLPPSPSPPPSVHRKVWSGVKRASPEARLLPARVPSPDVGSLNGGEPGPAWIIA